MDSESLRKYEDPEDSFFFPKAVLKMHIKAFGLIRKMFSQIQNCGHDRTRS